MYVCAWSNWSGATHGVAKVCVDANGICVVCMSVCMCVCMYVCMYVYVYVHGVTGVVPLTGLPKYT
jgi:hypothetical protein